MSETSSTAHLEVVVGSEIKKFSLDPGAICQIGRDEQNTIVLADNQVSRRHALVQCGPGGEFLLADLGSRNGTWVNQRRVTSLVALRPGDRIGIGGSEILFHGPGQAEPVRKAPQGETAVDFAQRLITVLVVDIRDFTGLSSRLPEARLSEVISAFIRESGTVLADQGAWAQKYSGDSVMAIWLHPNDTPAWQDLAPAFAALKSIAGIAAGLESAFGLDAPIRVGAGINTGVACVGNMGSDASSDYTALSDAVNLAFRLESATKEIGRDIALGQRTYDFLADQPGAAGLFERHTVPLKGYREPKPVFAATWDGLTVLLERLQRPPSAGRGQLQDTASDCEAKA
jgi:class 3 adenylate cyclase